MNLNKILSINPLSILSENHFGINAMQHITDSHSEPHRYYHDMGHIKEMLAYVDPYLDQLSVNERKALQLAILWHDDVYDPKSKTNEDDSYNNFITYFQEMDDKYIHLPMWQEIIPMVQEMIYATKEHNYTEDLPFYTKLIIKADLNRFNGEFKDFWRNTIMLFKEYAPVDWDLFKNGRIAFLKSYAEKVGKIMGNQAYKNCMDSATVLSVWEPKIAIYAGSFDPLHKGHLRIVEKAEKIFDKVIIARGQNPGKPPHAYEIPEKIQNQYQVDNYTGWITNYIKSKNYNVTLIRGLRNGSDLNGEINFERYLKDLMPEIQIVSIFTDADVEHISSSGIKELIKSSTITDTVPDYIVK